jgi:hypothetical protein
VRARNNLGVIYLNLNQPAPAIEQFSEGLRIAPDCEQTRKNLDRAAIENRTVIVRRLGRTIRSRPRQFT